MRSLPALAVLLAALEASAAPQHWLWERGLPQGNNLAGVTASGPDASNQYTSVAVGDFGSVVTWSGSTGWTARASGTANDLTAVATASPTVVYAVGAGGTVLKSTDAGASWATLACSGCGALRAVAFRSPSVGVVAGSAGLFYTTNGGATFAPASGSVGNVIRLALAPGSTSTVIYALTLLGSSATVLKSSTDGASWSAPLAPPLTPGVFSGLSAVSDSEVYLAGELDRVYKSTTSATSWAAMTVALPAISYDFIELAMTSSSLGYAIAKPTPNPADKEFKLFKLVGTTWSEVPISPVKTDVWPQALWARGSVLFIAGQGGMLFRATNGAALTDDGNATGQRYFDVAAVDADHQVASGAEGAISVGNFGKWSEYRCSTAELQSVAAGPSGTVVVGTGGVVCTADNTHLETWTLRTPPSGNSRRSVAHGTGTNFYTGGDDGLVWYSTNNGAGWTVVDPDTTQALGIAVVSARPGLIDELWVGTGPTAGGAVKLYRSATPTVSNYTEVSAQLTPSPTSLSPPGNTVRDISWLDQETGFLVVSASNGCNAGAGYVYRTTNHGGGWTLIASLPTCFACFGWKDVQAQSATSAWVQGERCFSHLSLSGSTWSFTSEAVPTPFALLGLGGSGAGELWMVGNYGAVLHSHCGGTDTTKCTADSNSCTDGSCRPSDGECLQTPNVKNACTDSNLCTLNDHCEADGTCLGSPRNCDDSNQCTTDTCELSNGSCLNVARTGACDDGQACTTGDTCVKGLCTGAPVICQADTQCTAYACDPGDGGCAATFAPSTASCDDGLSCTSNDLCDGKGACGGSSACQAPQCQVATCLVDGGCGFSPIVGFSECDDGDGCTVNDVCKDGFCKGERVCVDAGTTGGGGGGGSSGAVDAGPAQPVFHPGCGCGAGGGDALFGLLLALGGLVRRGRRAGG